MKTNRIVTALDVGSSKITTIIANIGDNSVDVMGVQTVPSRGIKKGVVVNLDDAVNSIAQSITSAERMADITVSSVFINISGKMIKSLNNKGVIAVARGEIAPEDVMRAIDTAKTISIPAGEEILHIIPREFIIDSQGGIKVPIGMSGNRLEVDTHLVMAPTTVLKNLAKCIDQLGIEVEGMVFSAWADSHAVLTDTEKELGVTLLDIGAGTTDIIIFQEGAVAYSGSLPVGGFNITNDLAVGLHISLEDAEQLKLKYKELMDQKPAKASENIDKPSFQKSDTKPKKEKKETKKDEIDVTNLNIEGVDKISRDLLEKIVSVRVEEIFELARNEVARAGFDLAMPAGVVLVGGTAKLAGITSIAKNHLNTSARVGVPHGLSGMVDEIMHPEYATAQGMIKYAVNNDQSLSNVAVSSGGPSIVDKVKDWFKSLAP